MSLNIEQLCSIARRKLGREHASLREKLLNRHFLESAKNYQIRRNSFLVVRNEFNEKYQERKDECRPACAVSLDLDFIPINNEPVFPSCKLMRTISIVYEEEEQ